MPNSLPIDRVVDVAVYVSAQAAATPSFNSGLIVDSSNVIPTSGANSRVRQYASLAAMSQDGFTSSMPAYIAAQLYFSQSPSPTLLYVGAQGLSAMSAVNANTSSEGTGYVVGDILTVLQGAAMGGTVQVTTIGASGAVTGVVPVTQGNGYSVATGLSTTGGTGTGAEVDITVIGESPVQALTACRDASSGWYAAMVCGAAKADHLAIASYVQAATPQCVYFYSTSDADAPTGSPTSVFGDLEAQSYNRALGLYSTVQGGAYPANAYAAAAVMGVAMGLSTGLANSQFTLKFKSLVGVAFEPLTQSQVAAIEAVNGNVCVSYAGQFSFMEQGTMASGAFFDSVLGLDVLASGIQYAIMNRLVSAPSIPQTDAGQTLLMSDVEGECDAAVTRGFLAPGTWTGTQVLNLAPGAAMPKGYVIQSLAVRSLSKADKAARKASPIYVSVLEASAIHSVTIGVYVQQ